LDIKITNDSSLLLHAMHGPFYWRILMKWKLQYTGKVPVLYSCFNNSYKKIPEKSQSESRQKFLSINQPIMSILLGSQSGFYLEAGPDDNLDLLDNKNFLYRKFIIK
jgi:hypothetical protein